MPSSKTADSKQRKNQSQKQVDNRDQKGRFKKGASGNYAGRPPKGYSISETIRAMMDEQPGIKMALATVILDAALEEKDIVAMKMIWQYMDGMPEQKVKGDLDVTTTDVRNPDALKRIALAAGFVPAAGQGDPREE